MLHQIYLFESAYSTKNYLIQIRDENFSFGSGKKGTELTGSGSATLLYSTYYFTRGSLSTVPTYSFFYYVRNYLQKRSNFYHKNRNKEQSYGSYWVNDMFPVVTVPQRGFLQYYTMIKVFSFSSHFRKSSCSCQVFIRKDLDPYQIEKSEP
jgi:hypothetical protein